MGIKIALLDLEKSLEKYRSLVEGKPWQPSGIKRQPPLGRRRVKMYAGIS
jgi:hypothetical protein